MKRTNLAAVCAALLLVLTIAQGCDLVGGTGACGDSATSSGGERIGVMKSTDGGASWTLLGYACFNSPEMAPVDPDPVLENGKIVVYFYDISSQRDGGTGPHVMYRAESDDGILFSTPVAAYSSADTMITDPAVLAKEDGTYRMYLSAGASVLSATSTDGITFTLEDGERSNVGGVPGVLVMPDGRIQLYVCGMGIISLISDDGIAFTAEDGVRIETDGTNTICDPHPIQLHDGTYLMTYKSRLNSEGDDPSNDQVHLATSTDGMTWQTGGEAVTTGSVPGIVQLDDGTLLIYYVDFSG